MLKLPKIFPEGRSYVRIPSSKAALLRVLLETVERGSKNWTSGSVPIEKAIPLADKFALLYGADATVKQRSSLRARYRAATQVFFWPEDPSTLRWWLMASEGEGLVHERERLADAWMAGERLNFGDEFRLTRRQRDGEQGGAKRWTWVLSPEEFERHLAAVRDLSRAHGPDSRINDRLNAHLNRLKALPGFAGVRQQKLALQHAGREAWTRTHSKAEPFPWSDRIPYLTKAFACYHRPEPLKLDVFIRAMGRRTEQNQLTEDSLAEELLGLPWAPADALEMRVEPAMAPATRN